MSLGALISGPGRMLIWGTPNELRSGQFILEDQNRKILASLGAEKVGAEYYPALTFFDENGKKRTVITGSAFLQRDENGRNRTWLNTGRLELSDEDGTTGTRLSSSSLVLRDENNINRTSLSNSSLFFRNANGQTRASIHADLDRSVVCLWDETGKPSWVAP